MSQILSPLRVNAISTVLGLNPHCTTESWHFQYWMVRHYEMVTASRKEALAATEEILNDNGIRQQCSADMSKGWDLSRVK